MVTLIAWEMMLFLGGLAAIVFYQILTGRINLQGLLWEKNGAAEYSWGRVQSLFFTLTIAFIYIGKVMRMEPGGFPEIPPEWLKIMPVLLGGSNLGYLSPKIYNLIFKVLLRSDY